MSKLIRPQCNSDTFYTIDVRPDDSDTRDYIFQPSLALLPDMVDNRKHSPKVFDQKAEGACVGFALAAVINISLNKGCGMSSKNEIIKVSARMLYEMAKSK